MTSRVTLGGWREETSSLSRVTIHGWRQETAVAADTISINDFGAPFYEGASGSRAMTVSGSHTGATSNIQVQIEKLDGTPVVAWATLQSGVAEGAFSGSVSVPRGGLYKARVRKASNVTVNAVQSSGWGVGILLGAFGQSQLVNWQSGSAGSAVDRAYIHDGTSWQTMPAQASGMAKFAETLIGLADCPVAVIASAVGGSALSLWWTTSGGKTSSYNDWEAKVTASGGKMSAFMLWQGEGDVLAGRTKAQYKADTDSLFAQLRTDYGAGLPVLINQLGRSTALDTDGVTDAGMEAIRDAHVAASHDAGCWGIVTFDQPIVDVVHFSAAAQLVIAQRQARAVAHAYGQSGYGRSPSIRMAVRVGATVDVVLSHGGGTDFTPATGITGFTALDGATPIGISSAVWLNATTIRLTLASVPTGVCTIRYGYGKNPDISAPVLDNTGLALPLETTDDDVLAASRRISLDCKQRVGGAAAASVSGLNIAVFKEQRIDLLTTAEVKLSNKATDASGVLDESILGTSAAVGDYVTVVCSDADGTHGADSKGFVALVEVLG